MKLITLVRDIENWVDLKDGEYLFLTRYNSDEPCNIVFKCPGCNEPLSITNTGDGPKWEIDFVKLTATPSIYHKRDGRGCGWHGYLTEGNLEGKIE